MNKWLISLGVLATLLVVGLMAGLGLTTSPPPAEASHLPDPCNLDVGVEISKEAEGPDSRTVISGSQVTFTITVSNPCHLGLKNIMVTDPLTPECDRNIPPLPGTWPNNPISTFTYQCTTTQGVSTSFTNIATVTAFFENGDGQDPGVTDSDPSTVVVNPDLINGRITGGGNVFVNGTRVTRGFELHCDRRAPNNLQVNFHGGNDRFHLDNQAELLLAECFEHAALSQDPPPGTPFDTFVGKGIGSYNGEPGAVACFVLVDDGEPGDTDMMAVQVFQPAAPGDVTCSTKNLGMTSAELASAGDFELLVQDASQVKYVSGVVDRGNIQAHADNK